MEINKQEKLKNTNGVGFVPIRKIVILLPRIETSNDGLVEVLPVFFSLGVWWVWVRVSLHPQNEAFDPGK